MTDFDAIDFFTDKSLLADPYAYFDYLRDQCPIRRESHHGVLAVTGYDEAVELSRDAESFSSCISVSGPFFPLPFASDGEDLTAQIEAHRDVFPMAEHMVTMDPPAHTRARALLSRLLTPRRLNENEDFMWPLADSELDRFLAAGRCEFLRDYAKPFSLLVIADLLGVPEEDRAEFRDVFDSVAGRPGAIEKEGAALNPLTYLEQKFTGYVEDRRRQPRDDVLSGLASAKYPDGSTPEAIEVVRLASFLFGAGQETTAKLLTAAVRFLAEDAALQERIRADRSLIPAFIEETLRLESPVKSDFRLAKSHTTLAGHDVPAGTIVMSILGAANRDPRKFDDPHALRIDRKNVREHITFGRGVHACPGAPLARVEGRITLERLLDRTTDITICEAEHGPPEARRYDFEPTFIMRGLTSLHIEFTPAPSVQHRNPEADPSTAGNGRDT
jgi:cytochrome P450